MGCDAVIPCPSLCFTPTDRSHFDRLQELELDLSVWVFGSINVDH